MIATQRDIVRVLPHAANRAKCNEGSPSRALANWEKRLELLLEKADAIEEVLAKYKSIMCDDGKGMVLRRRASQCLGRAMLTREITRGKVREARTRIGELREAVGDYS